VALSKSSGLVALLVALSLGGSGCASSAKIDDPIVAGSDPWFTYVRRGNLAILQGLIDGGKDVDAISSAGTTALMVASRNGSIEVVKWLLSKGADPRKLDQQQQSALVYGLVGSADGIKRERLVEILIQAGADPFKFDAIGFQPLREMIDLEMNEQVKKLKFTNKKPCDLDPKVPGIPSLARTARRAENIPLAEFFEREGCW
jgi:ankyrin repeat protein